MYNKSDGIIPSELVVYAISFYGINNKRFMLNFQENAKKVGYDLYSGHIYINGEMYEAIKFKYNTGDEILCKKILFRVKDDIGILILNDYLPDYEFLFTSLLNDVDAKEYFYPVN